MTNRFGVDLHPKEVRWAAAEGVTEDVIAAVLLLHERSVEEIVPQLSPLELEKVIELVGRSPPLPARNLRSTRPAQKFDGVRTDAPERPAERGGQGRDQAIRQRSPVPERLPNWPRRPAEPNRARETCRATFDTSGNTPRSGNRTVILGRRWSFGFRLITVSYISVGAGSVAVEARPACRTPTPPIIAAVSTKLASSKTPSPSCFIGKLKHPAG
jgi:hypothetical protein